MAFRLITELRRLLVHERQRVAWIVLHLRKAQAAAVLLLFRDGMAVRQHNTAQFANPLHDVHAAFRARDRVIVETADDFSALVQFHAAAVPTVVAHAVTHRRIELVDIDTVEFHVFHEKIHLFQEDVVAVVAALHLRHQIDVGLLLIDVVVVDHDSPFRVMQQRIAIRRDGLKLFGEFQT